MYLSRDTKLGRDVALKILPSAFAEDAERLARFEREARTLASLNHPSIAQIHAQALQWGPPRQVLSFPRGTSFLTTLALTDDGKRVLAASPVETNVAPRPLTVILNWLSGVSD